MSSINAAKEIAAQFDYPDEDVRKSVRHFIKQMHDGLEKDGTSMSQIPTYVTGVPNGTEKGLYLAVDLGGTNFRVCSIELHGDTTFHLTQTKVAIPKELMRAKTAKQLFSFLAKQIELFLKEHHEEHFESHIRRRQTISTPEGYRDENVFKLGFTFSFPVHQIGINRGTLIRWTKGFDIPDAVGKDVCKLLQDEIDILKLPVRVSALVNDTVGTLMSRSYTSPGKTATLLGAIFGTGTNGAYVEKLSNIKKPLEGDYDKSTGEMVVNTEWGSFDNELDVLPTTKYDIALDKSSINPGIQLFEKRISGMFLGELLRLAILDMNKYNSLFVRLDSSDTDLGSTTYIAPDSPLYIQDSVDSSILSIAEADESEGLKALRLEIEKILKVDSPSYEDAQAVKLVAHAIGKRAARLSAVAVGAVVLQSGRIEQPSVAPTAESIEENIRELDIGNVAREVRAKLEDVVRSIPEEEMVDIGVDGSLVEFYPGFKTHMRQALRIVDGLGKRGEARIRIGIAKDGSGVGAALIALVAERMATQENTKKMEGITE